MKMDAEGLDMYCTKQSLSKHLSVYHQFIFVHKTTHMGMPIMIFLLQKGRFAIQ